MTRKLVRTVSIFSAAALSLALLACGGSNKQDSTADQVEPVVRTTFYPTTYFAERIAGGLVPVDCPVPSDADPKFWRPGAEDIAKFQKARMVVINGASFEKWIGSAALEPSRIVDSAKGFEDEFIEFEEAFTHSHGPAGEHTHKGIDGHTWLDPVNARRQAEAIAEGMKGAFPEHAEAFDENLDELRRDLSELERRMTEMKPRLEQATLLASHPAFNYMVRRMGVSIANFDFDPESALSEEQLAELAASMGENAVILWESEPLPATTAALEAMNIQSVLFSPAESIDPTAKSAGVDYLRIMNDNLDRLDAALNAGG